KATLFRPLQKGLTEREALTAGARKAAEASLAAGGGKAGEYEGKFRDARSEVYREQEETRRVWMEDQARQIAAGQARTGETLATARQRLAEETAAAKAGLV